MRCGGFMEQQRIWLSLATYKNFRSKELVPENSKERKGIKNNLMHRY
jgi:hypothetical protein